MQILEYLITYEVFDKGCIVMRYYDEKDNVLHKKFYLFYTIDECKQDFLNELKTIFL